jgi:hypothetical protein
VDGHLFDTVGGREYRKTQKPNELGTLKDVILLDVTGTGDLLKLGERKTVHGEVR